MRLIVGLGNKGEKYALTRHNFGFLAVEKFAKKYGFSEWKEEKKFFAKISTGEFKNEKTILLQPQTYMNLSGQAVQAVMNYYKISRENLYVFSDDLDLSFGTVRFRESGGSGGHNGLKSIISVIGENFARVKFGIANKFSGNSRQDMREYFQAEDFVLQKFAKNELDEISIIIDNGLELFNAKI